jgi:hypothetical protein
MKLTLEDLKSMTNEELWQSWLSYTDNKVNYTRQAMEYLCSFKYFIEGRIER